MKKLAFISDLIFTFCASFLFTACFFRFLRIGLILALLLSAICGTLTTCAAAALLLARRKKFFLKKADEETKNKLLVHLALLSADELTDYFFAYFQKTEKENPVKRRANKQISVGEERYFLNFRFAPISADEVAEIFRVQTDERKILLCSAIEPQAKSLCEKLKITIRTGEEIYAALKKENALPQTYLGADEKKKRKLKFQLWFAKSNARRFLTSAAMIFLIAYITPFFYYYLIFGTVLLLASIFIRIFGYEPNAQ